MAQTVLPPELEAAWQSSPEMIAMRQAFFEAFVSGSPLMIKLREEDGMPEAVPIKDFWIEP